MDNQFSNVFFICCTLRANLGSTTAVQNWGISGCFGNYDRKQGRFRKTGSQRFHWASSMVYCFAVNCKNDSNKSKGISYHQFPKDPTLHNGMQTFIDEMSVLCSNHFIPDCFQQNLGAELMGTKSKARLKPGAVLTIFSHRPSKK